MTTLNAEKVLAEALQYILGMAKDHPAFDAYAFEHHDLNLKSIRLGSKDRHDWTMIAIRAADALQESGYL